jgi:hypothetical protein
VYSEKTWVVAKWYKNSDQQLEQSCVRVRKTKYIV